MTLSRQSRVAAAALAAVALSGAAFNAAGQESLQVTEDPSAEFQFVRLIYGGGGGRYGYGRGRGSWLVDWPEAEYHFMLGLNRLTRIDGATVSYGGDGGRTIALSDDAIFNYPWLYAVEVGRWYLDDYEAARLREYLLRGGFLMVDDFHGTYEWAGFIETLKRVFPDRPVLEIPEADEVWHVLYDLDNRIQIPGIRAYWSGRTYEQDGVNPHWRGIYDDDGRLVMAINFNMDLGDAWEHADTPGYPEPMTALALRFAVNYVIYAMTH